jgi:two-component system, OmpR family, sensor histidine kinase MprB
VTGLRVRIARLPLRTRVGALAALGVGLAVLVTATAAYFTVRMQLTNSVDDSLLDRARQLVATQFGDPSLLRDVPSEPILAADVRIAMVRADGAAFVTRGDTGDPTWGEPEVAVAQGRDPQSVRTVTTNGDSYRVVAVPAGPGRALVLGQSTATVDEVLQTVGLVSLLAGAVGIALAAWAGASIARAGLRPVEQLTAAAEKVAQTGRLDPIQVEGDDEIARLAHAFNAMLGALGEAQLRQRRLVADAGHELRTPLTSLRTNIDLLAQSDREGGLDPAERAGLIADVKAQLEELSTLATDLMELAREDPPTATRETLDFADVVRDSVNRVQRRAPELVFSADLQPWPIEGDAQLLARAVTNLLDNAATWSPPRGKVTVTLREGTLEVCDEGPGIAPADMPRVFDRFYRAAEARSRPGSGLGLAIVRAAAERHGGQVRADRSDHGGARLTMTIPGAGGEVPRPEPTGSSTALA